MAIDPGDICLVDHTDVINPALYLVVPDLDEYLMHPDQLDQVFPPFSFVEFPPLVEKGVNLLIFWKLPETLPGRHLLLRFNCNCLIPGNGGLADGLMPDLTVFGCRKSLSCEDKNTCWLIRG